VGEGEWGEEEGEGMYKGICDGLFDAHFACTFMNPTKDFWFKIQIKLLNCDNTKTQLEKKIAV
jgi:hypothetical protein